MEQNKPKFQSAFERTLRAGKRRTYFFDVRATKTGDYYLTISESVRKNEFANEWDRHKIFLYKEDLNRFAATLNEAVNVIKTELMPQYDYDEFTRKQEEYEAALRDGTLVREPREPREPRENNAPREYTKPPREQRLEGSERFVFNNNPARTIDGADDVETKSAFKDDDLGW
jgi:hypothetical protein